MKRHSFILILLIVLMSTFVLSSCSQGNTSGDSEKVIKDWLEAWSHKDLEKMLNMTTADFKEEANFFYSREFDEYAKLSYSDLKINLLEEDENHSLVQAEFQAVMEAEADPSTGGQVMITKSAVRQTFELKKENGSWLINSIERQPAS